MSRNVVEPLKRVRCMNVKECTIGVETVVGASEKRYVNRIGCEQSTLSVQALERNVCSLWSVLHAS